MSTPLKPWEVASSNLGTTHFRENVFSSPPEISQMGISNGPTTIPEIQSSLVPPIPSRSNQSNAMLNSFTPYGSNMGSIGSFNTPYSYYNNTYNNPYNLRTFGNQSYNQMPTSQNSFSQIAENNTRQAFHSIESMVSAFTSISMMLDSTYHALYNSFRAVISVADHFSRMRAQLVHVFSSLAILRTMRWLYRKLLSFLSSKKFTETIEEVWTDDIRNSTNTLNGTKSTKSSSSWPVVVFLSIVFGSPWLIWKILKSLSLNEASWMKGECEHFIGRAKFDFTSHQQDELSFKKDQMIKIAPKEMQPDVRGWLMASINGESAGLIPANYIEILGKQNKSSVE